MYFILCLGQASSEIVLQS